MVLKLTVYIRNIISFSDKPKKKPGKILVFFKRNFQNVSILAYILLKISFFFELGHDYNITVTSYLDFGNDFVVYGTRRSLAILLYKLFVSGGFIFKFIGGGNYPFGKQCSQKGLVGRGLMIPSRPMSKAVDLQCIECFSTRCMTLLFSQMFEMGKTCLITLMYC